MYIIYHPVRKAMFINGKKLKTTEEFALYPGLFTPVFVACSINTGGCLVKLVMCSEYLDTG